MRYIVALLIVLAVAFGLFLYSGNEDTDEMIVSSTPVSGGIYYASLADDPPTLDPAVVEDTTSVTCVLQIFDTLVKFGEGNRLLPSLAERWEVSADQKTYTFIIRKNVRFHKTTLNGKATKNGGRLVTAEDFVYSFKRVIDPAMKSPRAMLFQLIEGAKDFANGKASHISGLEATGEMILKITLEKPFAPFLATLTMPNCAVVPKEDVKDIENFSQAPVGTGPFVFYSYDKGRSLQLLANEDYFNGKPYLDKLNFIINSDEEAQFKSFLKGKVFHTSVPDPQYTKLRMSSKWAPYFTEVSQLGTYYIGMNHTKAPFDNPLVRKAISMAVDKNTIVKYIRAGRVLCAKGPLPPGIPGYNPGLQGLYFNPEKSEKLLDKAGFPRQGKDGVRTLETIHLHIPRGESDMRVARAIQANLADVGINCVPVVNEWQEHLKLVNTGQAPFFRLGWVADYLDADSFLYYEFHSSNIGVSNSCNYKNARVDELLTQARTVLKKNKREDYYQEAEQLIVNDCVWICLYYYNTALVRQPFVHGLNLTPLGEHMIRYDNVWIDKRTGTGKEKVSIQ